MLNNYEAIVKAVLDKTKFDSDMGELVRKQHSAESNLIPKESPLRSRRH